MRLLFRTLAWLFRALLRTRNDLAMENMALRQQLSVYGQLKVKLKFLSRKTDIPC